MSAFIVEDKSINIIVSKLYFRTNQKKDYQIIEELKKLNYTGEDWSKKLSQDLFNLNCKAVNQRYGKNQAQEFRPLNFKPAMEFNIPLAWALKCLHCLEYQCSEGNIPETKLYKLLKLISNSWAYDIAANTPEYNRAPWN